MPKIIKFLKDALTYCVKFLTVVFDVLKKVLVWLKIIKQVVDPEVTKAQDIARVNSKVKPINKGVPNGKKSK